MVLFAFSYGTFIGFWGAHYACEKIGCLVLPTGAATSEARVKAVMDMGVTTVCSTPTYALRMCQAAAEMGIDLAGSNVNKIIVSGEPAGSVPTIKRQLESSWGAKVGDNAGMTEIGTIMTFECSRQPGGTHIIEDNFIEETIEHDGDRPVPYGERAERVVTSFGRGFIPLIRYRTKDLVVKVPYTECGCGRTGDLYMGGIQGRWDDMKLVRGTNVYPLAVESIVRECSAVDEFQILLTRDGLQDEITVRIELKPGREDHWDILHRRLCKDLPDAHEGLRFNVERAEHNSLPRFELKAKRLVDKRPVADTGETRVPARRRTMHETDLLGQPMTAPEQQLLQVYRTLKSLAAANHPPCVDRNVKKALACMWQVVNDLNLEFEQVYDVGV